ncbi:MAG: MFS transporter [Microbacteriaceae bacterium]|jgi:predicted MFS family arabinose efflux permease|nr:MFS transporter [Microbacteriaceae bacterium]
MSDNSNDDGVVPAARMPYLRLLVLASVGFITVTTGLVTVGLLPQISADFAIRDSQTGLLTAGYAGVIVVTVFPLMATTRRVRRRALLVFALAIFVASNLIVAASPTFAVALTGRLIGGIAQGLVWALLAPFIARMVAPQHLGKAMTIVFGGNTLGLAAGAPLGALLGEIVGWRAIFVILAALTLVLLVAVILVIPHVVVEEGETIPFSVIAAIRQPGVISVALVGPLLLLTNFSMLTYLAPYVIQSGLPPALVGAALSLFGIAGLAGVFTAGLTVERWGRAAMISVISAWIASFVLLAIVPTWPVLVLAIIAVWGASTAAASVLNQNALIRTSGSHKDAATTLTVVLTQGGVALGAVLGGFAADRIGLHLLPLAAVVPAVLALIIVVLARHHAFPGTRRQPIERVDDSNEVQAAG